MSGPQLPAMVMIIRHGEKPGSAGDGKDGGKHLSLRGSASRTRGPSQRLALDHARERTRGWITIALVAPVSAGLIAVLGLAVGSIKVGDLKELFASMSPLIGSALGFYFGRHTARR